MARSYEKSKGRRNTGTFAQMPHQVFRCPNYVALSHLARSLLVEFLLQYNTRNNGDLTAVWKDLSSRGWSSKTTLSKHIDELLYYEFITVVQEGGINVGGKQRPSLYALTWLSIDKISYSDGFTGRTKWKIGDIPGGWKTDKEPYYPPRKKRLPPSELKKNKKMKYTSCTRSGTSRVLEIVKNG